MTSRSDLSIINVLLDEQRAFRNEMNIEIKALRLEIREAVGRADAAHDEIAKYRNRFYGWLAGVGGGGAMIGMSFADGLKSLAKAILS